MRSNVWYLVYYKTIEILFGCLVIASYYILQGQETPIALYLLLTIPTTYLFIFLIQRFQEKSRFLFFIIVFPVIVIGGLLLGFPIIFVLLLSMLIYWRTTIMNSDSVQTGFWLFMIIFFGFILLVFAKINSYHYLNPLIIVMFVLLAFIILGGFMINWFSIQGDKLEKRQLLRNFLTIIGIIVGCSLLLVAFMDGIKWTVVSLLKLITFAATFLLSPIFIWVENYELTGEVNPFAQIQNALSGSESGNTRLFQDKPTEIYSVNFDPTFIYMGVIIILCTILFIVLYKKFQGSTEAIDDNDSTFFISSSFDEIEKKTGSAPHKRNGGQPSYRIRKEIYRLEKIAEKLNLGRISSETIGEWFKRVGVEEDESLYVIYKKVRYGNVFESDEEYRLFLKGIEKKKIELKQLHKVLLEEVKIESTSRMKNIFKGFK